MKEIKEKLLFAAHGGKYCDQSAAIIMSDHALPIACSHWSYGDKENIVEYGIHACWESCTDVEEFFGHLGIEAIRVENMDNKREGWKPQGLYVYEVIYIEDEFDVEDEHWPHLRGGELRRPWIEELEPLTLGLAPWGGIVL